MQTTFKSSGQFYHCDEKVIQFFSYIRLPFYRYIHSNNGLYLFQIKMENKFDQMPFPADLFCPLKFGSKLV